MEKNRLEAFSDGVLAIIITIMVLELKIPTNPTWATYLEEYPIFLSYALSFVLVGLFWSSHHHIFHIAKKIDNNVLWWNMFFLFWLSLIPFATASMGENHFSSVTVTIYALLLAVGTIAYIILEKSLSKIHRKESKFSEADSRYIGGYWAIAINMISALIAFIGFPKFAFFILALTTFGGFLGNIFLRSRTQTNNAKG